VNRCNRRRILDEKKWDRLGRFRRVPVPSRDVRRRNASEIGGAVGGCRKLSIYRFLCRHIRPIPASLEPHESGCRIASGCLIIARGVPRASAPDLLRSRGRSRGDAKDECTSVRSDVSRLTRLRLVRSARHCDCRDQIARALSQCPGELQRIAVDCSFWEGLARLLARFRAIAPPDHAQPRSGN